jgi:hypothetical protein
MKRASDILSGVLMGLALSFALPASARGAPSLDGYSFERPEFEQTNVRLTFVPVRDQVEMKRLAGSFGLVSQTGTIKAFSIYKKGTCVIYAEDPRLQYEPEFLGHELAHCIFGNFHPEQSKEIK